MKSKYFLAFFLISIMLFSNLSLVFSSPNPYTTQTPYNKTGVVYDDSLLAFFKIGGYFFGDNPMNLYNCAVNVVHCMIGGNKFNLSLQLLSNDIENGEFDKGSIIKDGQIFTSLFSINKVLQSNGKNVSSFYMDVDVFTRNLKVDEDAILWVNDDHYIYVAKNSKGQFEVSDNNIAKGNMQNYSYSQFNKLLKGERISSDFYLNLNDSSSGPFSNKLTSNNVSKSINNFTYNNNKNPFIVVTTDSKNIKKIYKKTYTHTPNKKDKNTKKRVAKDKKSKEKYLLSDKDITKNKKTNKENKSINSHNTDVATEKNKPSPKQDINTDKNSNKDITTAKKLQTAGRTTGKQRHIRSMSYRIC